MKKFFFAAVALVFSANAMALDNEPEVGLTTTAFLGMNISNINNTNLDAKVGGKAGVKFDYVLPNAHGTYVSAGAAWSMKGAKTKGLFSIDGAPDLDATFKTHLHYLEIPIHVGFRYNMDKQFGFYGEFGPYFAMGFAGRQSVSISADGYSQAEKDFRYNAFKNSSTLTSYQRWDAGLGILLGAEYNQHYNLTLGFDWGITDMYRDKYRDVNLPGYKPRNFAFTLAFGYRF